MWNPAKMADHEDHSDWVGQLTKTGKSKPFSLATNLMRSINPRVPAEKVLPGNSWVLISHDEGLEILIHHKVEARERIGHAWLPWEQVSVWVDWLSYELDDYASPPANHNKNLAHVTISFRNGPEDLESPIKFMVGGNPDKSGPLNWVLALRPWDKPERTPLVVR